MRELLTQHFVPMNTKLDYSNMDPPTKLIIQSPHTAFNFFSSQNGSNFSPGVRRTGNEEGVITLDWINL